jgi:TonB family protein
MWLSLLSVLLFSLAMPDDPPAGVPQIRHFVSPHYPPLARTAGVSGRVTLKLTVDAEGNVSAVSTESSPHPLLEQEARGAVQRWKFDAGGNGRRAYVDLYYAFSGKTSEYPRVNVSADFAAPSVRVFITTDPPPLSQPSTGS